MLVKIPQSDYSVRVTVVRENETVKHNFWPGTSREVEIDADGGRVYLSQIDNGGKPIGEPQEVVDPEEARIQAELEAERLEAERLEAERLEAERLEAERLEAERLEAERLEAELKDEADDEDD